MRLGSLFAGIGGFDLGFERAGMKTLWQVEMDNKARAVLETHFPNADRSVTDVKEVTHGRLPAVDVLCGGFPCQDVSVAGKREGLDGERSGLWFEFERIIGEYKPGWVVIENVPGLLSSNGGADFGLILYALVKFGYGVCWRIFDSQYFGVAQRRRRLFIVGHLGTGRANQVLFERESNTGDNTPPERQGDSETNYPPYDSSWWDGGQLAQTLDAVLYKKQALPEKTRFPAVIVPAWIECPDCEDYWCVLHGEHAYDCACPAVDEWAEYDLSPYLPSVLRYLTPVECERLQGFPDGWTDVPGSSDTARYKQLGNAVTVDVVEWIGRRIVEQQKEENEQQLVS